jgi:hypothetical protein
MLVTVVYYLFLTSLEVSLAQLDKDIKHVNQSIDQVPSFREDVNRKCFQCCS